MKKRYLILAGLLVMTVAAAGCGKKKTTETAPVEVTATPTPEVTKAVDMVDMQQTADEDIKNVMGEKTSTASKIVFVNNTGDDIQSLYIRTHVDEDSEDYDADEDGGWGDDLINGMFTLTDKDKALYYMQTANTQTSGTQTSGTQTSDTQTTSNKSTASYDIRIAYTDEDTNECFFRDIPLGTISQITLCMDGTDDDAIPYAKYLTGAVTESLKDLNFLDVKFEMEFGQTADYTANGTDDPEFLISTNPGEPVKPLGKVASGGELSRIMLAIKTVLADQDAIETLIFDEIDSGISGRTAQMVSEKMNVLAKNHQIICITHLPQIAAMADAHYLIEKSVENKTTVSKIKCLSGEESIDELARMLGGVEITEKVRERAREMKELAHQKKCH